MEIRAEQVVLLWMIFVALLEAVLRRNSFRAKALTNSINGLIIVVIIAIFTALTLTLFYLDEDDVRGDNVLSYILQVILWIILYFCYLEFYTPDGFLCTLLISVKLIVPLMGAMALMSLFKGAWAPDAISLLVTFSDLWIIIVIIQLVTKSHRSYERYVPLEDIESEFQRASSISKLFFTWIYPLLRIGNIRPLVAEDAICLRKQDHAKFQYKQLKYALRTRKIFKSLVFVYLHEIISIFFYSCFSTLFSLSGAFVIIIVELYLGDPSIPQWKGIAILCYLILLKLIQLITKTQMSFKISCVDANLKSALSSVLYKKSLVIRPTSAEISDENFSTAQTLNLMQVDLERMCWGITYSLSALMFPFQLALCIGLLYWTFGVIGATACIVCLAVLFISNAIASVFATKIETGVMQRTDRRLKACTELLGNIRFLKFYNWEEKFSERVKSAREAEIQSTYRMAYIKIFVFFLSWASYSFITVAAVDSMALSGIILNPTLYWSGIFIVNRLNDTIRSIPDIINNIVQWVVSSRRMDKYLKATEVQSYIETSSATQTAVEFSNVSFCWDSPPKTSNMEPLNLTLKEINLTIRAGTINGITGSTAAGKTAIMNAIIGNLHCVRLEKEARVVVNQKVAYCNQSPWILNATLRENILFGSPYDPNRYNETLRVWELEADLNQLRHKDATKIGEKGITLSGGQKARVALARAVYSYAGILLLDDILAAVDSNVGHKLFYNWLLKFCQGRTIILVTHATHLLRNVDQVILIESGTVAAIGPPDQVLSSDIMNQETPVETKEDIIETPQRNTNLQNSDEDGEEEDRQVGSVNREVYGKYFEYLGGKRIIVYAVMAMLCWQALDLNATFYITGWTEQSESYQKSHVNQNVLIYSLLGTTTVIFIVSRLIIMYRAGISASKKIFLKALDALLHAPVNRFYDITPIGRILNRLSKDQDKINSSLYNCLDSFIGIIVLFCTFLIICGRVVPWVLLTLPVIFVLLYKAQRFYLNAAREMTRLESISRSPIVEHFVESIAGAQTIRAYGYAAQFFAEMRNRLDFNIRQFLSLKALDQWLSFYLELSADIFLIVMITFILGVDGYVSPGYAALATAFSFIIPDFVFWIVLNQADLENQMIAVERLEYLIHLEGEAPRIRHTDATLTNWPSKGHIIFRDVSMRYRDNTPIVLQSINFEVLPCEKVGIVGRTGSGKSSITQWLFRIVELLSGEIQIDGVNISELGLNTLRSQMTLILQDPVLFAGTLRDNLDPFNQYMDGELLQTLSEIGLSSDTVSLKSLESVVAEGGSNYSAGERQLICIARAILRKTRIMLLDEATAFIDANTDALIQNVIRTQFETCTVMTIAHRIATIMDYDKVIVMEDGSVEEVGAPQELVTKEGKFYELYNKLG